MTVGASTAGQPAGAESRAAPLRPGDPRRLGAYQLLGRLGEGGMGTVFLASSAAGQLVAVKVVRPEYAQDERFRARFQREAEAAQRVARFCTAQVLAVGTAGEGTYLVTEYIDGPTLAAAVGRQGVLSGSMLDSLATGMAAALGGIHAAGVVHRDLKPSNVLLSQVGPKVIDFGIARALDGLDGITQSGQLVGTPAYMAPEQFHGASTTATDVFAWGAVVAFAGTGRSPFGTGSAYELMRRVSAEQPDLTGLHAPLRELVGMAMDKDAPRRPSARTLLLALVGEVEDPLAAGTRIVQAGWTAPPATTAEATRPGRRRGRRPAVVAALVAMLGLALSGAWIAELGDRPDRGSLSAEPTATGPAPAVSPDPTHGGTGGGPDSEEPQPVALEDRIPASGVTTLAPGAVHGYRLELATDQEVYLEGMVENCAHQLPWTLSDGEGGTVASGRMACETFGPLSLPAGRYELRIGGDNVDGRYAFRLAGR